MELIPIWGGLGGTYTHLGWIRVFSSFFFLVRVNVDVAGLSVAGLSIHEILNGHLGKCPLEIYMS